jgi:hypothetical protein
MTPGNAETEEAVRQYDSMIHALLRSYPEAIAEFERCINGREYRGAYVIVEKTMRASGISFTREQDRIAERFFSFFVY